MERNSFIFDARTLSRGRYPVPRLSEDADLLMCAWIDHAFESSTALHVRDHTIECVPTARLEALAVEVLRTPFLLQSEGCEQPIVTFDRIALEPDRIEFSISELYAAYLVAVVGPWRQSILVESSEADGSKALPLQECDRSILVTALQSAHRDRSTAWTCHAVYAATNRQPIMSRAAFGLEQIEHTLRKLGAHAAP